MLAKLRSFLIKSSEASTPEEQFDASDQQVAQAALMFHVIAADGMIHDEEKDKLRQVLETNYDLTKTESDQLFEEAKRADREAIDLYTFTSILKRKLSEAERLELVKNLWEMVYADGEIHELEDNVVWRIAELLAIDKRDRMELKRDVRREMQYR
ncbi:MAG: TerB family tellurite resistance protein [Hyphomicrobiales bacterium]|nr:TerB family tellurite resistance protein [Hyphomicrobiales bacterium]